MRAGAEADAPGAAGPAGVVSMWKVAAVYAPGRQDHFYRFYEGELPDVFGYRFRVVCVVDEEREALRIVDGLEQRRMRAKWRRRKVA